MTIKHRRYKQTALFMKALGIWYSFKVQLILKIYRRSTNFLKTF